MFRQSPRRNGRNKGLKIKHVLQISILLGVSVWLLYQVHHSDDKKPSVPSHITKKLHNVVEKDMLRLGRKDLKPKVKQPIVTDKKEAEEHHADEGGNETEPEELVQDHESEEHEDMKHEEDRENEEETTETVHEQINGHGIEEMKDRENGEKGRDSNGVKNEKINKHIEDGGEKENKRNEKEKKEGNQSDGGEEIKGKVNMDDKDEKKTNPNPTIDDVSSESGKDNTRSNNGPSGDLSIQTESKKESAQHINSFNKNTSQGSNLMPSVDLKSAILVSRSSEDSMNSNGEVENQKEQESNENVNVNQKEQESNENENQKEQESNENENNEDSEVKNEEGGVLEEEKEALTDLGTLPESGIGGSRSTENTAAE